MNKIYIAEFTAFVLKYGSKGEKSAWTYIEIPAAIAEKLTPGNRKSFRVKGKLDQHDIQGVSLLPVGKGNFIMPVNATVRKVTGKQHGDTIKVKIQADHKEPVLNNELMLCLKDDPEALAFFNQLSKSHRFYFSKWIDSAKTTATKANRIARTLNALHNKLHYGQMLNQ